jgi:hypothetical protein
MVLPASFIGDQTSEHSTNGGTVTLSKIAAYKTNTKIECEQDQQFKGLAVPVRRLAVHAFRWSQNTAWCTCRGWQLWSCSESNGKTNHDHHVRNLPRGGSVGDDGDLGYRTVMQSLTVTKKGRWPVISRQLSGEPLQERG